LIIDLPPGQGPVQLGELALALVLSAAIGFERGLRNKSAGLRTHTLVGLGAALFMLVSKYGFAHVPASDHISFDPSRVAAQIVSGIGFIGGGLIFVRRDAVRGLTTAAVVWVTAAIGMACGGGLPVLAIAVTAAHFVVVMGVDKVGKWLPISRYSPSQIRLVYLDGTGALRKALVACGEMGFSVMETALERSHAEPSHLERDGDKGRDDQRDRAESARPESPQTVGVTLMVRGGTSSVSDLAAALSEVPEILQVSTGSSNEAMD
jgi:putative Mg2+ transporter-C (MgtC) family protein